MTVRSSVRRRRSLGALALTALVLGGCSTESGAAAVVDGTVIPVADVHTATAELRPYLDQPTPASILAVLVAEPTLVRFAGEHGVVVSEQQVTDLLARLSEGQTAPEEGTSEEAEQAPADTGPAPEFSDPSVAVARFSLLQDGLRGLPDAEQVQADLFAELGELDVDVNPRFGRIDFASGGVGPVEHPWLVPAPEAAAP